MKAVVFAYHDVGVRCLSALLARGVDVVLVVTHLDNPAETIWFESVAELANRYGIPTITPEDPNAAEVIAQLGSLQPDFIFSFYYRSMLSATLLEIPKRGALNVHGSLLPKYRGRVPVNWAIIHGEVETGATLHYMAVKPDAGAIVDSQAVAILPDDTALDVFRKVTYAAESVVYRTVPALVAGTAQAHEQDLSQGRYFGGRKPQDGIIDWRQPAKRIHDLVRAVAPPYPGAWTALDEQTIKIRRTRWRSEIRTSGRPGALFARDARLFAAGGDGQSVELLDVELQGASLNAVPELLLRAMRGGAVLGVT